MASGAMRRMGKGLGWQAPTQGFRHRLRSHIATGDCHRTRDVVGLDRAYGANIRTNRMILLSGNITDNLFAQ